MRPWRIDRASWRQRISFEKRKCNNSSKRQLGHNWLLACQLCCDQVLFLSASVCLFVCLSAKNLENYWLETNVAWWEYESWRTQELVESRWHLTLTFDLWPSKLLFLFLISDIHFEWLYLATSFSWRRYIFRISRSGFSFKVMVTRSRSRSQKR